MPQAKTLTTAEIRQVLGAIALRPHAARNRALFLTTLWAGMRVGEVAALRYCDVLGNNGRVLGEVRLLPEQTKGRYGRTVYLNERLQRELQDYVCKHPPRSPQQALFYTQKRDGFTRNTLAQHFHKVYKWADLKGASSHSGRRTFCTTLAAAGVGIRVVQSLAGHRSIQTTARYIDVNDDMKRRAIEII